MSKLCQCREKKIIDILEDVCDEGWCRNDVNALFRIIESDCVCEKPAREKGCKRHHTYNSYLCTDCERISAHKELKEKQSQSPCDHELEEVGNVTLLSDPPLYPCKCKKCDHKGNYTQEELVKLRIKRSCEHEPDEWNIYCKKCGYTFKKACKHSWKEKRVATYLYYGEDNVVVEDQWWCDKCGLVTCKNPNDK